MKRIPVNPIERGFEAQVDDEDLSCREQVHNRRLH
jgi:hypothetical protein